MIWLAALVVTVNAVGCYNRNYFSKQHFLVNNSSVYFATMSVSILDVESYCRVCLHVNEINLSIYDEVQEFNMSISDLLVFYAEMTVNSLKYATESSYHPIYCYNICF